MKKICFILLALSAAAAGGKLKAQAPQVPYEIKFNVKNIKDSVLYLAIYTFDKQMMVDTAWKAKDGSYTFKKKRALDKGMYIVVSQAKSKFIDFIINQETKFSVAFDTSDVIKTMKFTGSKENDLFLEVVRFMAGKTKEYGDYRKEVKAKNTPDSTKLYNAKTKEMNEAVEKFRRDFVTKYPKEFISDFLRLQMEPEISNPPKASNGRPDSLWQYQYYKNHYFDNIPLEDERILHTPLFADKFKNFFTKIVLQMPDSINKEIGPVMDRTLKSKEMFKWTCFWMTNWSETNKVMGFDAVFVHVVNRYYRTGKVDFYTKDQVKKIVDRASILEPLLIGKVVPELLTVDTNGIKLVKKVKLDTCKTSQGLNLCYTQHKDALDKELVSLHAFAAKSDYTVLLFWDIDCGHCKKEVPVIFEKFKELRKEGLNIRVHAVYTQHDYDDWLKTIRDMKLIDPDWQNVVDGVHLQNLKEKFDIFSTPVIYILDKGKVIRYKRIAADQISDVIHNLENQKKPKASKTDPPKKDK
jgi:thiol-disulfide isomerase/thioredoxin